MVPMTAPVAPGVLPDAVIRDRNANAYLFAVTLSPDLDGPGVQSWLKQASVLIEELEAPDREGVRAATACSAFGASFFLSGGSPRFGLPTTQIPTELATPPELTALAAVPSAAADVLFYVMSTSEARVAAFERGLSMTHPALAGVSIELGFQRADGRESFGFLDGLRNAGGERRKVAFLDVERNPEEPAWAEGGSYLAYIKIQQNLEAMAAKTEAEREAIIGRRVKDGSRIDLPEGTRIADEEPFSGTACPVTAHIRKAGPRGALHDETKIFRRGVPYLTLNPDGSVEAGLQFVSFQRSLEDFAVIFSRWITNASFPEPDAGEDALLTNGAISLKKAGFFFAPPFDPRYLAAGLFDPLAPDPCATGQIVVQKRLVDTNGHPISAELGGITFQITNAGQPVGEPFATDSSGRGISPPAPRGVSLTVHEVTPPPGFEPTADETVTLSSARELIVITNHQTPGGPTPVYSG